jgi:hypothetical protein
MSSLDTAQVVTRVGPALSADGSLTTPRATKESAFVIQNLHGQYYEQAARGNLYMARAIVTAPVIFTTAAGTGGPLLWNPPGSGINASILAVSWGTSVVTTVAAVLGLTGGTGQTAAPTSTTAIDSITNCLIGGGSPACSTFRVGTTVAAGTFLMPFGDLHTGALTVDNNGVHWVDIGGLMIVPPGAWCSISASATATTTVGNFGMVWEEVRQ